MIAQFKSTSRDCVSHIVPSLHFDKGGAEDAIYETLSPQLLQNMPETGSSATGRMTILHKSQPVPARMPGFAYWLLVLLVAASTFWICGGYALFTPHHVVKSHISGLNIPASTQPHDSVTRH